MAFLGLLAFGGNVHTGSGLSDPIVEIWECTIAANITDLGAITQGACDALAAVVQTWFEAADTHIASTNDLSYVKWNEYSLVTGRQVTDPTIQTLIVGSRGISASSLPFTTSYRISLDDSTRDRRHAGGFYVPRPSLSVQADGRWSPGNQASLLSSANDLLTGINGVLGASGDIGVWSRRDKAVHVSNRFRIGDVPDNIRRRKNAMREVYAVQPL